MLRLKRRTQTSLSEELLLRYLDNQVQGQEKAQLEAILDSCASCRDELEHLRRWLPYRMMARQQIPASDPTPEFSTRLLATIRQETRKSPHQSAPFQTHWWQKPAQLRRFGLVAASLILLAGVWSVYTLANQPARSTTTLQETLAAAQAGQASDAAMPEAALAPDVTAAGAAENAKGLPETDPGDGQIAEARLFTAAVQAWYAIAQDFVLPVSRQSAPDVPVLAGEILPDARSAIWVEPDRLVAAWPIAADEDPAEVIPAALSDLAPQVSLVIASSVEARQLLSDWLGTESGPAWQMLEQPDCHYLILEFGGN